MKPTKITGNALNTRRVILKNKDKTDFKLSTHLTYPVANLLIHKTKIKNLYISERRWETTPPKQRKIFIDKKIKIHFIPAVGRPYKYDREELEEMMKGTQKQAEMMGMPRRTYYYWRKRMKP